MLSKEPEERAKELQAKSEFWLILETPDGDKLLPFTMPHVLEVSTDALASQEPYRRLDLSVFPDSKYEPDSKSMIISYAYDEAEQRPTLLFSTPDGKVKQLLNTRQLAVYRSATSLSVVCFISEGLEPIRGKLIHGDYAAYNRGDLRIFTSPDDVVLLTESEDGYEDVTYLHRPQEVEILKTGMRTDRRLAGLCSDFVWEWRDGVRVVGAEVTWSNTRGLDIDYWGGSITLPVEFFLRERFSQRSFEIPVQVEETSEYFDGIEGLVKEVVGIMSGRITERNNRR